MERDRIRARKPIGGVWSWEMAFQTNMYCRLSKQMLRCQELEWNTAWHAEASRAWALG